MPDPGRCLSQPEQIIRISLNEQAAQKKAFIEADPQKRLADYQKRLGDQVDPSSIELFDLSKWEQFNLCTDVRVVRSSASGGGVEDVGWTLVATAMGPGKNPEEQVPWVVLQKTHLDRDGDKKSTLNALRTTTQERFDKWQEQRRREEETISAVGGGAIQLAENPFASLYRSQREQTDPEGGAVTPVSRIESLQASIENYLRTMREHDDDRNGAEWRAANAALAQARKDLAKLTNPF